MEGLMPDWPLLVYRVLDHAARWHGEQEIVSRSIEGPIQRHCYTSGTTGNPKGVVYYHRSNVLHAMTDAGADAFSIHARDTVMTVVPMFHANAWSLTFSCLMAGAKLVMQSVNILISPMRHDQCIG